MQQHRCGGLNFGYYYDRSPIIAYDDERQPGYSMYAFTASTVSGCGTPHFWLRDGRSLYDAMGDGCALLRFDSRIDVTPREAAAAERRVPLKVIDVTREEAGEPYRETLILARPDQHIAWRGETLPRDPMELIELKRGARTPG